MPSRSLAKAKEAYRQQDHEASRRAHQPGTSAEEHRQEHGKYIKSMVYGGLDGIITTFAVVAGVAGASLSAGIVLILGFANLIADGLSMAIGDYLSTKAENEYNRSERNREQWEVDHYPQGEKQEMIELYMEKGLSEADAQTVVDIIAKDKRVWVDIMMVEELGIIESDESPAKNAVATFLAFAFFGFVPLAAFVISQFTPVLRNGAFLIACLLTALTLFALGALKVLITGKNWLWSGLETFFVGGVTAAAAYGIGYLLSGLAG